MKPIVPLVIVLCGLACSPARTLSPTPTMLSKVESATPASAESCFVLRPADGPVTVRKGGDLCALRFVPASTFKIPNALIALETKARVGPDDVEPWDGTVHPDKPFWDRDHSLASAMQNSVLWYFQRTARRIGLVAMDEHIRRLRYGNMEIGNNVEQFWLTGPLAISADEQAAFQAHLARRELPLRRDVMDSVDEMILQTPGKIWRGQPVDVDATWDPATTRVYAKTGSMDREDGNVRWLVGHVTHEGRAWAFASLVTSHGELSAEAVTEGVRELRAAGLLKQKSAGP